MKYNNKRIIGITGGIGSGKTKILEMLKDKYDALVIEADKIGHELQKPGAEVYNLIIESFGESILEEPYVKGISYIDRKKLGQIVFSDKHKLEILNQLSHPAIHNKISQIINSSANKYIFIEAAILTETSLVELTDELWYIHANEDVRLERLQKYRHITKEKALLVMKNQPDEEYFKSKCHIIIDNSYSTTETLKQIQNILDKTWEEHYE